MSAPPLRTAISDTYPNPSNATARAGFGALYDYVTSFQFGQCRLVKSGANLVLQRLDGLWLAINDKMYAIPAAGVALAPTGLTPNTNYFVYAFMSGATMTLEAVTTAPATDANTGVRIKNGDAARTLVGQVRVIAGPAFADTTNQRYVLTWFNRRPIHCFLPISGDVSTSSGSQVEVEASWRPSFLAWSGDLVSFGANGAYSGSVPSTISMALYSNGGCLPLGITDAYAAGTISSAGYLLPFGVSSNLLATADGLGSISLYGATGAGLATWKGGASPGLRSSISVVVQG
ncbi:MAG: hypothetical protein Q7T70_02550 [Polaromonas sp.]|nr:hypothetical protein [Polaromonas sp.]